MKTTKCNNLPCFACNGKSCKVLNESITDRPCPFCKTDDELEAGRNTALLRLTEAGRLDLIDKYTANVSAYSI